MTVVVIEKPLSINILKLGGAYYLKHFFDDLGLFREFWKSSGLFSIVSDYYHIYEKSKCSEDPEKHSCLCLRLHNGVFSPYTGIKTNLLFFTQRR